MTEVQAGKVWPTRTVMRLISALLFLVAVFITSSMQRKNAVPPEELIEISGVVDSIDLQKSMKSKRMIVFTLKGQPGSYWTQAVSHERAAATWREETRLRFFAQRSVGHLQSQPRKAFGLMVNGETVQTLEEGQESEKAGIFILRVLSAGFGALALCIFAYSCRASKNAAKS